MQQNSHLIELDKDNQEHLNLMYLVRAHPEVDCCLRGNPPENYSSHVNYLQSIGPHKKFYIIQSQWVLCGYCQLTLSNENIEIGMALHPNFCNRGLGSKALAELLQIIQEEYKNKELILFVKKDNLRAISLYRKHSFEQVGEENEWGEYLMKWIRSTPQKEDDAMAV